MMVYQIGGYGSNAATNWEEFPSTRSQFWSKWYDGAFLPDFREGMEAGKEDLADESFTYLNTLESVEVTERGNVWRARLDGYIEATKSRGPTKFG